MALDDFGTGYSSLLYLQGLPIDRLKVDRSFVAGLGPSDQDATIISTVVDLAHDLGLRVVAEGVETEAELRAVGAMGCDEAQGFLLGRPGPAHLQLTSADGLSSTSRGRRTVSGAETASRPTGGQASAGMACWPSIMSPITILMNSSASSVIPPATPP